MSSETYCDKCGLTGSWVKPIRSIRIAIRGTTYALDLCELHTKEFEKSVKDSVDWANKNKLKWRRAK